MQIGQIQRQEAFSSFSFSFCWAGTDSKWIDFNLIYGRHLSLYSVRIRTRTDFWWIAMVQRKKEVFRLLLYLLCKSWQIWETNYLFLYFLFSLTVPLGPDWSRSFANLNSLAFLGPYVLIFTSHFNVASKISNIINLLKF